MLVVLVTEERLERFKPYIPEDYLPLLSLPKTIAIGAVDEDTNMATGILIGSIWSRTLYLDWLYVGEQFRNAGVARVLLCTLAYRARDLVEGLRAEFDPENEKLKQLLRRCAFEINCKERPLYQFSLGELHNHFLFKSFHSSEGILPLAKTPPYTLHAFGLAMERSSAPVDVPILLANYDGQLSQVCIVDNEIVGCLLAQSPPEKIHLAFVYADKAHNRCLVPLICVAAQKAFESYPDNTPISIAAVDEHAAALVQKLFEGIKPMELCVATFRY